MEFNLGDELEFEGKKYLIMSDIFHKGRNYFLLSTTDKPVTGLIVEYELDEGKIYINKEIDLEIEKELMLFMAKDLNISKND